MSEPMLSRIAESLFWIGRYVERADGTTRILDATLTGLHGDPWADVDAACRSLLSVMGLAAGPSPVTVDDVLRRVAYDAASPSAIVGALAAARENARGAREVVSSELWESLNGTWNSLPSQQRMATLVGAASFFAHVRDRAAALGGIVDSTMSRDDGYRFLVLGRSLERVDMMCRLLSVLVRSTSPEDLRDGASWTVVLRACSGHEAFLRAHRGATDPALVLQFLLIDRLFPRSVYHALSTAEQALALLDPDASRTGAVDPARRLVGRARTSLEYVDGATLLVDLERRLARLERDCLEAGSAVAARYFQYASATAWSHEEG